MRTYVFFVCLIVRSKTGSEVGDSVGNHDPDSGRGLLRQIFNVVHAPFDGQKSGASEKQKNIEISPTQLELQARVDPPQDKIVNNEEEVIVQPQVKTTTKQSTRESKQVSKPAASSPLAESSSSVAAVTKTDPAAVKTSPAQKPAQPQTTSSSSSSISVSSTSTKQDAGFQCKEKDMGPRVEQRSGNYWVFYNYIQAEKKFECHETITYTTHGEYHFLHNLEPLLKRWQGPISVSIYTPGNKKSLIFDINLSSDGLFVNEFVITRTQILLSEMVRVIREVLKYRMGEMVSVSNIFVVSGY